MSNWVSDVLARMQRRFDSMRRIVLENERMWALRANDQKIIAQVDEVQSLDRMLKEVKKGDWVDSEPVTTKVTIELSESSIDGRQKLVEQVQGFFADARVDAHGDAKLIQQIDKLADRMAREVTL